MILVRIYLRSLVLRSIMKALDTVLLDTPKKLQMRLRQEKIMMYIISEGADFRLKCTGCEHQVMLPRKTVENSFKGFVE